MYNLTDKLFFFDQKNQISISYKCLFENLKQPGIIYHKKKYDNTADYLINFLKVVISQKKIIILDFDFTDYELDVLLNQEQVVLESPYEGIDFDNFENLIKDLKQSSSEIILFTSGTSGQPKKVVHNIANLIRNVRISENHTNNIWSLAYNPTHIAGIQVFFQAFFNFNSIYYQFNLNRNEVLSQITLYNISHISATPTFYRLLLPTEHPLLSVTHLTLGGEKSNSDLYNKLKYSFPNAKFFNIYASTEAGSLFVSHNEGFKIPSNLNKLIKIIDNEIIIHKSLLGNFNSINNLEEWYSTGDVIEWIDAEEGIFKIFSRKNEMINVAGNNVNPHEVEEAILCIPGIENVCVYGKQNSVIGTMIYADIIVNPKSNLTENTIKNHLKAHLQNFKIPRKINFVEEFNITRTGKIIRNDIKK